MSCESGAFHGPLGPPLPGGPHTILLADDDRAVRDLLTLVLRRAGFSVLAAGDGEEALRLYSQHQASIAIVILDVRMPRLDGISAYRGICAIRERVPAILWSGYMNDVDPGELAWASHVRILEKPCTYDLLLAAVGELIRTGLAMNVAGTQAVRLRSSGSPGAASAEPG